MLIKIQNEENYNIRRDIGVYILRCIPLNKIYIGSTNQSFRARFSNHCKFLSKGNLANKHLQNDYNKYGPENFQFEILGVYPKELTIVYENKFINDLKPHYNVNKAYNNSKTNLNKKFSKEHKEKIRQKSLKFKHSNLEFIAKQNKEGANKFRIINLQTNEETFLNSTKELKTFFNVKICLNKYYNNIYKNHFIKVLKTQKKKVKILINDKYIEFSSYEKCDKFLNKWRGYTSTQSLKNVTELNGYPVIFN